MELEDIGVDAVKRANAEMVKEYWETYNEIASMGKISVSELSVGDYVCAISGTRETPPMKVVGLGESWVNLEIDPEQGDPYEFEPSEIRGIPITAEVLERNGFRKIAYSDKIYGIEGDNSSLIYYFEGRVADFRRERDRCSITCNYIHELQRALCLAKVGKEIEL